MISTAPYPESRCRARTSSTNEVHSSKLVFAALDTSMPLFSRSRTTFANNTTHNNRLLLEVMQDKAINSLQKNWTRDASPDYVNQTVNRLTKVISKILKLAGTRTLSFSAESSSEGMNQYPLCQETINSLGPFMRPNH